MSLKINPLPLCGCSWGALHSSRLHLLVEFYCRNLRWKPDESNSMIFIRVKQFCIIMDHHRLARRWNWITSLLLGINSTISKLWLSRRVFSSGEDWRILFLINEDIRGRIPTLAFDEVSQSWNCFCFSRDLIDGETWDKQNFNHRWIGKVYASSSTSGEIQFISKRINTSVFNVKCFLMYHCWAWLRSDWKKIVFHFLSRSQFNVSLSRFTVNINPFLLSL